MTGMEKEVSLPCAAKRVSPWTPGAGEPAEDTAQGFPQSAARELGSLSSKFRESLVEGCSQGQLIPWCFAHLHTWAEWSLATKDLRQRAADMGGRPEASVPGCRERGEASTASAQGPLP